MKRRRINVLYKKCRDLILFEFSYTEYVEDLNELIDFHFCDRHDFNERVEACAKSVFKNFYENPSDNEPKLIDYEEIK